MVKKLALEIGEALLKKGIKSYNVGYGTKKQVIDKITGKKRNVLRSLERDPEDLVILQPSGKKVKRKDARYVTGKGGRILYVDEVTKDKHIKEVIIPELKRLKKDLPSGKARNIKRDILTRHINKKLTEEGFGDKTINKHSVGRHANKILGKPTKSPIGRRKTKASEMAKKSLLEFLRTKGEYPVKRGKVVTTRELMEDPIFQKISPSGAPGSVEALINRIRRAKGLERDLSMGVEKNIAGLTRGKSNKPVSGILKHVLQESYFNPRLKKMLLNAMHPRIRKIAKNNDKAFIEGLHEIIFPARTQATPPTHANVFNRNRVHYGAELRLRRLGKVLKDRDLNPDEEMSIFMEMSGIEDDMIKLGLQSEIDGVVYGQAYAKGADKLWKYILPIMRDLKKSYPLKELPMPGSGRMRRPPKFKEKGFQAGGLVGIGSKILAKLAKKLSEKEMKMILGSLWKGVDPKQSGRYKVWDKRRWGPGYKWPWKKSRIRGPEMKKSHYASLSDQAKDDLRKRYRKKIDEYIKRKREDEEFYKHSEFWPNWPKKD